MLSKRNRVDTKGVEKIFKYGRSLGLPLLNFKFILSDSSARKISVIIPKSVAKLAVTRNRLKRLAYTVLRPKLHKLPEGILGVLVFRKKETNPLIIEHEIQKLLDKVN